MEVPVQQWRTLKTKPSKIKIVNLKNKNKDPETRVIPKIN